MMSGKGEPKIYLKSKKKKVKTVEVNKAEESSAQQKLR